LLSELLRVFLGTTLILLLDFIFLRARLICTLTDLLAKLSIFKSDSLSFFLEFPFLSLKLSSNLYMVSHNLVVEDLLLLELSGHLVDIFDS